MMQPTRRHILSTAAVLTACFGFARAQGPVPLPDPRMAERSVGSADAKVVVQEWFSFTCPHCARFATDVFPEIKAKLIDTGKVRFVFCEYPRDQSDLMAAMVARSLPPARYLPFLEQLMADQMHWAFDRNADPKEELAKEAALAGMSRELFDKVTTDQALQNALLAAQKQVEAKYDIDSTPTFIVNGQLHSGETDYATFAGWVGA